jgi:hypothetical protein
MKYLARFTRINQEGNPGTVTSLLVSVPSERELELMRQEGEAEEMAAE